MTKYDLSFSVLLSVLIVFGSVIGLLIPDSYSGETGDWAAQALAQDAINLFLIAPFLLLVSFFAYHRNATAYLLWGGTLAYVIYTFLIYCFAVHFNPLFLCYCLVLGISAYSFVFFLIEQVRNPTIRHLSDKNPARVIAIYFIIIACSFCALWLSEIIPALMSAVTPPSLSLLGLFTNPVHVIDLSLLLPGVFLTAI